MSPLAILIPVLALIAIAIAIAFVIHGKDTLRILFGPEGAKRSPGAPPYHLRPHLLTEPERRFARLLEQVAAHRHKHLCVQVPLAALLQIPSGTPNHQTWRNKIDRKTIDFVLTDADYRPVIAIEYDDSSHSRNSRRERDAFVGQALESAGLPLVRIGYRERLDAAALDARLGEAARPVQQRV